MLKSEVENRQPSSLCCILGVPNCVRYAALYLEAGVGQLKTKARIQTLKFWLWLHFLAELLHYVYHMLIPMLASGYLGSNMKLGPWDVP